MSVKRTVLTGAGIGGSLWGASVILTAIASAPVTAPIAAAGGAIVGASSIIALFGGRK